MAAPDAVRAVAAAVGARQFATTHLGNPVFPPQFTLCTTVGTAKAGVVVSAKPNNAVLQDAVFVVPPGQTPNFRGSVVNVFLTGPGHCP